MKFVPKKITRTIGRQILVTKKNSPHIAFGVGLVGVVGATVMACRATLKLEETMDDIQHDIDQVKDQDAQKNLFYQRNPAEYKRDIAYVYGKGTGRLIRLYGPSVAVGGASIGLLAGSHVSMTRRNAALTATLTAVSAAYESYRARVAEVIGEDQELGLYFEAEEKAVKVNKDGKKEKQIVTFANPNKHSVYARFFDESSKHWTKDPEVNRLWVQSQQNYLNNLLEVRGHVFLNEAYDALGIERSSAGAVVGWVIGEEGDNYIDFGMFEASEPGRAFVNGWERSILLDFNVDGVIYDKI